MVLVGKREDSKRLSKSIIRKGQKLPRNTITFDFNKGNRRVQNVGRDAGISDLQYWFGGNISVEIEEEVRGLGRYGKTLTVLTAPGLDDQLEELEQNEALRKSWEPKYML